MAASALVSGVVVVSRPVRRILCRSDPIARGRPVMAIPLGRRLPDGSSGLPGGVCGRAGLPLSDLAPGGVCRAARVTPGAGALLPHRCTLTCAPASRSAPSAVCSLWHFPASHPDWVLPSTLPCGVRTFLGRIKSVRGHPADSPPASLSRPAGGPRYKVGAAGCASSSASSCAGVRKPSRKSPRIRCRRWITRTAASTR